MLDLTWQFTGLSDELRPEVTPGSALPSQAWTDALHACMEAAGYAEFGFGWGSAEGYFLSSADDDTADRQLAFYGCVAQHPMAAGDDGFLITTAQLDYVYDHYRQWTVPCLLEHDYALRRVIDREEFAEGMGAWTPYWELALYDAETYDEVIELCGPSRPPLQ